MSIAPSRKPDQTEQNSGHWPRDIIEAYERWRGPYTVENADALLEEEPLELYNGWLVWDKLTDFKERTVAANVQEILSMAARQVGFGQAYPDQVECELSNGDVIKPDVCLISREWVNTRLAERGPNHRLLLQGGPELAVELCSPSNTRAQERRKRGQYFENGTLVVWDIDPEKNRMWVWRAEDPTQSTEYREGDLIDCEPFLPGWKRAVADFFSFDLSAEQVAGKVAQEWRAESREEGRAEGREEGRAEGREEGKRQALLEMLVLQARLKFGTELTADLETRLGQLRLEQLTGLVASIATSPTLADWQTTFPA